MAHKDQMMMLKVKDNEAEKSTFERFEQELKNTIFGVTFIMLKTEQESTWQLVVMMFIQACQLFSLVFNPSINFPWRGYTVTTYFQNFLQVFQIAYWCTFVEWVPYLIIFYAAVFIVILIIIDILYAVYTFTNKKIAAMWPLRLLRYALFFLVTILFMPFVCIPPLPHPPFRSILVRDAVPNRERRTCPLHLQRGDMLEGSSHFARDLRNPDLCNICGDFAGGGADAV